MRDDGGKMNSLAHYANTRGSKTSTKLSSLYSKTQRKRLSKAHLKILMISIPRNHMTYHPSTWKLDYLNESVPRNSGSHHHHLVTRVIITNWFSSESLTSKSVYYFSSLRSTSLAGCGGYGGSAALGSIICWHLVRVALTHTPVQRIPY